MNRFSMKIILVLLVAVLSIHSSCPEDQVNNNKPPKSFGPHFPTLLSDPIPWDILGEGKLVFNRIGPLGNNYSGVYVIDVLTRQSWGIDEGLLVAPSVSPDGLSIAYSKYTSWDSGTAYDIHIMSIKGESVTNVSFLEGQDRYPTWTPDSSQIVFRIAHDQEFYRQSPIPNPPDRQIIKLPLEDNYLWTIRGPFFVSKDFKLTFVGRKPHESEDKIYKMDIDGLNITALTAGTEYNNQYYTQYHSPAWSPDGTKIAFLLVTTDRSTYEPSSMEIMLMVEDGSNLISLIKFLDLGTGAWHGYEKDFSICWSPDGSKIAFNKKDGYLESHIYLINPDGSGLTQVTFAEAVTDRSLSWSR